MQNQNNLDKNASHITIYRFCSGTCVINSPFSTPNFKLSKTKISISFCVS